ncbi:MBL fold metallo-hydrolase [Peribacillus alkalitolerans]|uniref:MBL fold metallo-hydrolase n=1 Tax=Peribacillus alkalitolerans TaxID=1550385 RepID=UPI0013D3BF6A|nr:MBL fold metallo-hydrolase [Peribacillus alkalitolerans]
MTQYTKEHINIFQSALFKTTSTVVEGDNFILIVDPNWLPNEIEAIQKHVEKVRENRELYILFTHGDFDHIIGYKAFPEAKIIGSKGLQNHPEKEKKLRLIKEFDHNYYIDRDYPIEFPECDIVIEKDGQTLQLGNSMVTFYLAPGHSHDGIFTIIDPLGIWISGDYLSDFELPFIYDSAIAYKGTLKKAKQILQKHVIKVLVPGHGEPTEDIEEIQNRIKISEDYLDGMKEAVLNDDIDALKSFEDRLPYTSDFTAECHKENIEIMKREYKKGE